MRNLDTTEQPACASSGIATALVVESTVVPTAEVVPLTTPPTVEVVELTTLPALPSKPPLLLLDEDRVELINCYVATELV